MVAFASERAFSVERPVLPSLHSLGLLNPPLETAHTFHEPIYTSTFCPLRMPQQRRSRQVSSSSSSSSSRASSPRLFDRSSPSSRASTPSTEPDTSTSTSTSSTSTLPSPCAPPTPVLSVSPLPMHASSHPNAPPVRFRLEPCTLAEAQAIVLVPPPSAPFIPSSSMPQPPQKQQALLLLGHSLEYFRQPNRQLAKGARIHPYRITPSRRTDMHVRWPAPVLAALPKSVTPVTL